MAAIGLNVDIKMLFNAQGLKALGVGLLASILAIGAFLLGTLYIL